MEAAGSSSMTPSQLSSLPLHSSGMLVQVQTLSVPAVAQLQPGTQSEALAQLVVQTLPLLLPIGTQSIEGQSALRAHAFPVAVGTAAMSNGTLDNPPLEQPPMNTIMTTSMAFARISPSSILR